MQVIARRIAALPLTAFTAARQAAAPQIRLRAASAASASASLFASSTRRAMSSSSASSGSMRAIVFDKPGDATVIEYRSVARPSPAAGELLIRVRGTACNRADLLQRQGKYPPPPGASDIMGLECVGEVAALGDGVDQARFKVGDRVMALLSGGGYATYVCVDSRSAWPVPAHMDWRSASAIPEVWLTAYLISVQLGGMRAGDVVLIHAGASGVGTALIQLAKLKGAIPIVTVGSDAKAEFCKQLGAAHAVNYKSQSDWATIVKQYCSTLSPPRDGVSLVLDPVCASYAASNLEALGMDGRWILYGTMGGVSVPNMNLGVVLRKRLRIEGSTLRSRSLEFKGQLVQRFASECMPAFEDGRLKPIIDCSFTLEQMREAHEHMQRDANIGKIVIEVKHDEEEKQKQ